MIAVIYSSETLSVRGHCAPHRTAPWLSKLLSHWPNLSGDSGYRGQYQGRITLSLFGSARWSLAYQEVFLIFEEICQRFFCLGFHRVILAGVQANLAFSVGWIRSMGLLPFYCKDPCLTYFQFSVYPRLDGAGCIGKRQSCELVLS